MTEVGGRGNGLGKVGEEWRTGKEVTLHYTFFEDINNVSVQHGHHTTQMFKLES